MRPYMRAANVTWQGIALDDVKEMDFSPKEQAIYELKNGDILLAEASGSASEVGKPAIWRNQVESCCFQNTLIRVRSRGPLPEYLYWHFLTDARLGKFARAGKGVGINHLGADRMSAWPTLIPPLAEQKRIVARLEELTTRSRRAKEALDAVPPLLAQLRQSILAAAFRGDLTADWREKNPDVETAAALLVRIRDEFRRRGSSSSRGADARVNELHFPPEIAALMQKNAERLRSLGWGMARLELLCDPARPITYGIVQTGEHAVGGTPTVRCGDVKDSGITLTALKRVAPAIEAQYPRTRLRGEEVLVAIRGTVGGVAVAGPELAGSNISREVAMLVPLPGLLPEFLALLLSSPLGVALLAHHTKGVAQSGVNIADLRGLPIVLPPEEEQREIVVRVQAALMRMGHVLLHVRQSYAQLARLDAATLAKAFRGALVHQDAVDEPASSLLERVRAVLNLSEAQTAASRRMRKPVAAAAESRAQRSGRDEDRLRLQRGRTGELRRHNNTDTSLTPTISKKRNRKSGS
jgi:type I restriction enzyme S subunit